MDFDNGAGTIRCWLVLAGAAVCAAMLVAGCSDSPVAPGVEVYALHSVNGESLPAPYPDPFLPPGILEVTSGTLTLRSDGTFTQELSVRCGEPQPAGSECEISADGIERVEGSYDRAGEVSYGSTRFQATFDDTRVTIFIAFPPSVGFASPSFLLEYRR